MTPPVSRAPIHSVGVRVFEIPTDAPESDGTLEWNSTTLVLVSVEADGETGIGYTYADRAAAVLIEGKLAAIIEDRDALDIEACWMAMLAAVRNLGQSGLAAMAISAVDNALWDLKGKLLRLSVADLLGKARQAIPVYGSGGFTSYDDKQLTSQLQGWAQAGMFAVKMKVGRNRKADPHRMALAREVIGSDVELFVDANGAMAHGQALSFAQGAADGYGVTWFEEPVSANDLQGMRLMRDRAPAGMAITPGGICLRTLDLSRHPRGRSGGRTPGRCDAVHGGYRLHEGCCSR